MANRSATSCLFLTLKLSSVQSGKELSYEYGKTKTNIHCPCLLIYDM